MAENRQSTMYTRAKRIVANCVIPFSGANVLNQCTMLMYQDCLVTGRKEREQQRCSFRSILCVQQNHFASAVHHSVRRVLCSRLFPSIFLFRKQRFLPVVLVYGLLTLWNTTNKSSSFPCKSPQMVTCFDMAVDAWFKLGKRFSRIVASFSIPATYFAWRRLYCVCVLVSYHTTSSERPQ